MHHIELYTDPDHDAHGYDEEKGDFAMCTPVIVHCESREEAVEVAELLTEHFVEDADA